MNKTYSNPHDSFDSKPELLDRLHFIMSRSIYFVIAIWNSFLPNVVFILCNRSVEFKRLLSQFIDNARLELDNHTLRFRFRIHRIVIACEDAVHPRDSACEKCIEIDLHAVFIFQVNIKFPAANDVDLFALPPRFKKIGLLIYIYNFESVAELFDYFVRDFVIEEVDSS